MSDHIWTINGFKVDAETMCRHLIREVARRDDLITRLRAELVLAVPDAASLSRVAERISKLGGGAS